MLFGPKELAPDGSGRTVTRQRRQLHAHRRTLRGGPKPGVVIEIRTRKDPQLTRRRGDIADASVEVGERHIGADHSG